MCRLGIYVAYTPMAQSHQKVNITYFEVVNNIREAWRYARHMKDGIHSAACAVYLFSHVMNISALLPIGSNWKHTELTTQATFDLESNILIWIHIFVICRFFFFYLSNFAKQSFLRRSMTLFYDQQVHSSPVEVCDQRAVFTQLLTDTKPNPSWQEICMNTSPGVKERGARSLVSTRRNGPSRTWFIRAGWMRGANGTRSENIPLTFPQELPRGRWGEWCWNNLLISLTCKREDWKAYRVKCRQIRV